MTSSDPGLVERAVVKADAGGSSHAKGLGTYLQRLSGGKELWAIADQALVSGTNFATNIIIARALGLAEFGVFALAWMAVLFFSSMQMANIVAPMMSLGPKTEPSERPAYFGAVIVQEIVFALVSACILLGGLKSIATFNHEPSLERLALPLTASMIAYLGQDFIRRYLFTTKQSFRAFLNDAISCLPQLPLIFFCTRFHLVGIGGVLWFIGITSLVGLGLGIYWFEPIAFSKESIKLTIIRHWRLSRWLAPSALLWWTSTNLFVLVAPAYYGAMAAGVIRAANNMVAVAHIWFLGLDNVIPAETARILHQKGIDSASSYLKQMTFRWGAITVIFLGILAVAPGFWLHLAYGPKYAAYGYLLRLYSFFYVLVFTGRILGSALQALEYTAPTFWSYLLITTLSVVLAGPLTKHLGLRGVLLGMILTQAVSQSILLVVLLKRIHRVRSRYATGAVLHPTLLS